jgi:hypothetical protein
LGFGNAIISCLTAILRSIPKCQAALKFVYDNLDTFEITLTNALLSMQPRLHDTAVVVVVAYPYQVLNTPNTYNPPFRPGTLEITNQVRNLGDAVELVQRRAVMTAAANARHNSTTTRDFVVFYNGTKALFEGHEPHPKFGYANPNGWINEHFPTGGDLADAFHFNPMGHQQLGCAIGAFLTTLPVVANAAAAVPQSP